MYKLILNDSNKTELLVKDLLTSVIAIVIEDESKLYETKQLLTDNVFYDSTMYTEDGAYVGKITKKITPDSSYRAYIENGVCYGEFNVTTVSTQEGLIINLINELERSNKTIESLSVSKVELENRLNSTTDLLTSIVLGELNLDTSTDDTVTPDDTAEVVPEVPIIDDTSSDNTTSDEITEDVPNQSENVEPTVPDTPVTDESIDETVTDTETTEDTIPIADVETELV